MRQHQAQSIYQKTVDQEAQDDQEDYEDTPKVDLIKIAQQQGSSEIPLPDAIKREILGTTPSGARITATATAFG